MAIFCKTKVDIMKNEDGDQSAFFPIGSWFYIGQGNNKKELYVLVTVGGVPTKAKTYLSLAAPATGHRWGDVFEPEYREGEQGICESTLTQLLDAKWEWVSKVEIKAS